jgi:SAM-dependent methyltransferase
MGFFTWSAPLFHHVLDPRWTGDDTAALAARLRPFVPPGRGELLDLGGGTGALAARLAGALHARVTVLDPTPEMLAYVPAHRALTPVLGSAEAMPFGDAAFDALLVSDAFHHFGDQDRAVREMVRVVRPGGGVLMLELDPRGWMRSLVWVEMLLGEPGTFFAPDDLCAYLARRGLHGECRAERGIGYSFLGTVASPGG